MINKITTLYPIDGKTLTTEDIQAHLNEQNSLGWKLIIIDNMKGWYRFFWEKPA